MAVFTTAATNLTIKNRLFLSDNNSNWRCYFHAVNLQWLPKVDKYFRPKLSDKPEDDAYNDIEQWEVVELQYLFSILINEMHTIKEPGHVNKALQLW